MSERMTCEQLAEALLEQRSEGRYEVEGDARKALWAALRAADEVLAKLPRTKDGVIVAPGDVVYRSLIGGGTYGLEVAQCNYAINRAGWDNANVSACYSSREAAEAAKEATDGKRA